MIVWAATFHIVRDIEGIERIDSSVQYDGVVTMGEVAAQILGDAAYMLGFIAYSGYYGRWWDPSKALGLPSIRSLESMLNEAGFDDAFLDF